MNTQNELKRAKDSLARFERYLPMLQLKKRQLLVESQRITRELATVMHERDVQCREMQPWLGVLAEPGIEPYLQIEECQLTHENIAGISIPVFAELHFVEPACDLFAEPLWLDQAIVAVRGLIALDYQVRVLELQRACITAELETTSQRVNLFERVRIPHAREQIRRIRIYLGDRQTAAVVRGKFAKRKRIVAEGAS
ncbi:MAG: V/A-type H+-transporting ATPase subunit D [Rhodothermales bacterium]|jgi:V/A-type H+-transporting ATPase subunit D